MESAIDSAHPALSELFFDLVLLIEHLPDQLFQQR
jgi:hypothetical protein